MSQTSEQVLRMAQQKGVISSRELKAQGIAPIVIKRLCERGQLIRSSRGIYVPADSDLTEHHSAAEVCARVPRAVLCLVSALRYHVISTENPTDVWIALPRDARTPKMEWPPLRVFRFSGESFTAGIEEHRVEGVIIRVYSPAKTVVDCFKFRNKIGLDVALHALRSAWREKRTTMDELWHFAQVCRVANVMMPYLQSLVA